jgi:hypothetical protein
VKLEQRDRRALLLLAAAVVVLAIYLLFSGDAGSTQVIGTADSIPAAERRLERVRRLAAGVAAREQLLAQVSAELAEREKGVIQAETAAQAQAQLLNVLRRVAQAQTPPLEFGTVELSQQISPLGEDYGEVQVSMPILCHIDELVNYLADLTRQPEALAINDLRIYSQDLKQKMVSVRLAVVGVVPKRLVPKKKALF